MARGVTRLTRTASNRRSERHKATARGVGRTDPFSYELKSP